MIIAEIRNQEAIEEIKKVEATCLSCFTTMVGSLFAKDGEVNLGSNIFIKCQQHHGRGSHPQDTATHHKYHLKHDRIPEDTFINVGTRAVTAYFSLKEKPAVEPPALPRLPQDSVYYYLWYLSLTNMVKIYLYSR